MRWICATIWMFGSNQIVSACGSARVKSTVSAPRVSFVVFKSELVGANVLRSLCCVHRNCCLLGVRSNSKPLYAFRTCVRQRTWQHKSVFGDGFQGQAVSLVVGLVVWKGRTFWQEIFSILERSQTGGDIDGRLKISGSRLFLTELDYVWHAPLYQRSWKIRAIRVYIEAKELENQSYKWAQALLVIVLL